ncbi:MAG TPA: DUF5681 domain-containing protein [Candidatus Acidoferrales bacterium]|nr:DUF5681 domain-containing protein [Candidatus Acidoferrales bacterium]
MSNLNPANQWKPGQSGNPKGRPKKVFDLLKRVDEKMLEIDPNDSKGRTHGEIAADQILYMLKQGSVRVWAEYNDRKFGRPPQALAIATMPTETREQLIASILENARAMREDENPTIQ